MREFDDLVQATFLEVPKAARGFRGGASVKTWLFAIAANVARHHTRSALRRKRLLVGVAEPNAAGAPAVVAPPDELAERRQLLTQVGQALEALPHDLRVAFVGCVIEELPCAEVAGALGVPEGTLWRRVHEARTWIRASLESQR